MNVNFIIFYFSFIVSISFAQNVEGLVVDRNNNPISDALLFIENNGASFFSDNNGYFSIPTNNETAISLVVFKEGYSDFRKKIEKKDFSEKLNITLFKLTTQVDEVKITRKKRTSFGYTRINAIEGTSIYSTKKAEIIDMESINANVAVLAL